MRLHIYHIPGIEQLQYAVHCADSGLPLSPNRFSVTDILGFLAENCAPGTLDLWTPLCADELPDLTELVLHLTTSNNTPLP